MRQGQKRMRGVRLGGLLGAIVALFAPALGARPPAPALQFTRLHSGDGLSHNSVYAILQDREGFLWFGTVDGLNRYDGYELTVHRHDPADSTSLSNSLVRALMQDRQGRMWVGTEQGVDRFDRRGGRFVRYAVPPDAQGQHVVFALAEDGAGTLWAGSAGGLLRYNAAADRFASVPGWPGDRRVADLQRDRQGRLWALSVPAGVAEGSGSDAGGGELCRLDVGGSVVERLELASEWGAVFRIAFGPSGRIWLNARGPGLEDEGVLRPAHPGRPSYAYGLVASPDDALWIGTTDGTGVCRVSPGSRAPECHLLDPDARTWLHTYVRALYVDRAGALWVGTYTGVYHHDPTAKPFRVLRYDPPDPDGRSVEAVSAIERTSDGNLWVGTFGGGVQRMDSATGELRRYDLEPGRISDSVVWDLHVDRTGRLWAGGGIGLVRYDRADERFVREPLEVAGEEVSNVTYVESGGRGGLWLGTYRGLIHYDPASGRSRHVPLNGRGPGVSERGVTVVLEDQRVLWIGGGQGELSRVDLETGRVHHYVPRAADGTPLHSEAAYDLHRSVDGTLWLATGTGLHRFDPDRGEFRTYGMADGLPGAVVYSIAEDARGRLWLGTGRGLARFDPDGETFRVYDRTDGIGSVEFNRHATFRDPDGTLYLGGVEGLLAFHPEEIRDNPYVPPVVLTAIETASRDRTGTLDPDRLERLTLTHRDTSVTFVFAALSFTDSEKNRYAYRLEGFDDGWIDSGTRRHARYTNLPAGRYTFRVRGANNDGVWNAAGAALPVTVLPPFWQTGWFRLLMVLTVVGLLAAAYRMRVRRLLELERLRLRIAGDLHDDLASDLSGIALATDLLRRSEALPDADRLQLGEVRDTAVGMVEALRDIVWTINPEHDSLEATVRRMRHVAARLLGGLDHTFEVDLPDRDGALAMSVRRDVLLIYKEALHNAARHSDALHVAIRLSRQDGHLELVVEDDGCGFDPNQPGPGQGLSSMRARAGRMRAELEVVSRPGGGTRLRLSAPARRPAVSR